MIRTACLAAAVAIALVTGAPPASAQVPILSKAAKAEDAPAPTPTPAGAPEIRTIESIGRELAASRDELKAIEDSPDQSLGAPPNTPSIEIGERLTLARQLATMYQQQQDALARGDAARALRAETERSARDWAGFAAPPPHSVLMVDGLRDRLQTADGQVANAEARASLLAGFLEHVGPKVKTSQGAARLAAEAADRARGTPDEARLEWQRLLAAMRARVDVATQDLLQMGARTAREEAAAAESERALARRQLEAAGRDLIFPPEDLARVDGELAARRRAAEAALAAAARVTAAASEARSAADAALAAARAAAPAPGEDAAARAARLEELARIAELRREQAITANSRLDMLKGLLMALDGEQGAWKGRAEAVKANDRVQARAIYDKLTGAVATISAWREYLQQQLRALKGRIVEQEARLRSGSPADVAHAQQLLDTLRQREADVQKALEGGQPLERLLARFRSDFEGRRDASLQERARDMLAGAVLVTRRIWNYELFTVADTFETADGRRLEVERSVTVGKSAGAVLIVILGYWLCSVVMRRVERSLVRRGRLAPQAAALLRSWILFLVGAMLIAFALVSASIPLTAFAFLGGALAIAAGFGLQTLLRNFVAGIMLLFERPMRLGDLVEVDGFRGRVTSIGIRASTITSADGIETMIPNSTFVENKLTNWTYSSPQARQTITIGANYGTPLRRAGDVLLDVLKRHGRVLKNPEPQVYLDAYADSSVNFVLTYWLDMDPSIDSRRVKSDILHMIDTAFADAGFGMPFPQRDVHLDATAPLRVELVPPADN